MKTKGITLASAKCFLQVMAAFAPISVIAQLSFSLQKGNVPRTRDKTHSSDAAQYANMTGFISPSMEGYVMRSREAAPENRPVSGLSSSSSEGSASENALSEKLISFVSTNYSYPPSPGRDIGIGSFPTGQLLLYAEALRRFAHRNDYDTTYAFLSNMGMLSTRKRFFVVNLVTMRVEYAGMVAQGRGSGPSRFDKQYSNEKDSRCTSLGRYKILNKYSGEYGESYRLMGLDSTNSNAYGRNIVLHPMGCIPDEENLRQLCISEGCPAVSVNFMEQIASIIDRSGKPVLLWIFDSNLETAVGLQPVDDIESYDPAGKSMHVCAVHRREE